MSLSRRKFIKAGAVTAVSASLSLSLADTIVGRTLGQAPKRAASQLGFPDESQLQSTFYLVRDSFSPYLNTVFTVCPVGAADVDVKLVEVGDTMSAATKKSAAVVDARQHSFSLMFYSPRKNALSQGTYTIKHDALGTFALFVVPVDISKRGQHYEAIINRLS